MMYIDAALEDAYKNSPAPVWAGTYLGRNVWIYISAEPTKVDKAKEYLEAAIKLLEKGDD